MAIAFKATALEKTTDLAGRIHWPRKGALRPNMDYPR